MKNELEELGKILIFPCKREKWNFNGEVHNVEVTALDLVDERTWRSKRVLESYHWYQPKEFEGYLVHNKEIQALLPKACTLAGLKQLYEKAEEKGLFNFKLDEYGFIPTSNAEENPAMHVNRWITDSIHNLALVEGNKEKRNVIKTLADFYCTETEQAAFTRIIADPSLFRNPNDAKEGVAHIFQIKEDIRHVASSKNKEIKIPHPGTNTEYLVIKIKGM